MGKNEIYLDVLIRLVRGELSQAEETEIRNQVAASQELTETVAILEHLVAARKRMPTGVETDAARKMSERVFDGFRQSREDPDANHGIAVFDSRIVPELEGVRPAAIDTCRLKYRVGEWDVEISLYPITPDSYELMGQLTGLEVPSANLKIVLTQGKKSTETDVDRFHVFRFERVDASHCTLRVVSSDETIGTLDLDL